MINYQNLKNLGKRLLVVGGLVALLNGCNSDNEDNGVTDGSDSTDTVTATLICADFNDDNILDSSLSSYTDGIRSDLLFLNRENGDFTFRYISEECRIVGFMTESGDLKKYIIEGCYTE